VIELEGVGRTFQSGEVAVHALREVSLRVMGGEYLSIVGPSGSGKSTLLNLLGLLDRPTSGVQRFLGLDIATLGDGERAALRGHRIGFVFQGFHLLSHRTVLENVMLAGIYTRMARAHRESRATTALERVGLGHRIKFRPGQLSGGERQRVAIARAVVSSPAMLLCDEATGNLDTATSESILELFEDLHREGLTLIVVTHDAAISRRALRQVHMRDGMLLEGAIR
jgi:putative ABC transport system ATP-binding protein